MPAGQQAGECQLDGVAFAEQDFGQTPLRMLNAQSQLVPNPLDSQ